MTSKSREAILIVCTLLGVIVGRFTAPTGVSKLRCPALAPAPALSERDLQEIQEKLSHSEGTRETLQNTLHELQEIRENLSHCEGTREALQNTLHELQERQEASIIKLTHEFQSTAGVQEEKHPRSLPPPPPPPPPVNDEMASLSAAVPTLLAQSEHAKALDLVQTWDQFARHREDYSNKADFPALERLFTGLKDLGYNTPESVVLVGGTNEGQGSLHILGIAPSLTFFGFEIQSDVCERTNNLLASKYSHATVVNFGWDEAQKRNVPIGGRTSQAGLFDPQGQRGWRLQEGKTASTVRMDEWASSRLIQRTLFVLIDTEGHEPKVIRGMGLDQEANQQRFPLFQYELGGSWAANDRRHGNDQWTQATAAQFLAGCGYALLMVGKQHWLSVPPEFFSAKHGDKRNPAFTNEGFGTFVQGNLLAMHTKFTPPDIVAWIGKHTLALKWQ